MKATTAGALVLGLTLASSCRGGSLPTQAAPVPTRANPVPASVSLAPAVLPASSPSAPAAHSLLAGVDAGDPTAVASVFARDSWTLDTTLDTEATAEARLSALMTPGLAETVALGAQARATSAFTLWRLHRATTTVALLQTHDSGAPPDTPTTAYRSFALSVTPHAPDGWTGAPLADVEFLTLARPGPGGAWRISQIS